MFIKGGVGERDRMIAGIDNAYAHNRGMMQHLNALLQRRISTRAVPQVSVVSWGTRTFYVCASHSAQIRPGGSLVLGIRTIPLPCGTQIRLLHSLERRKFRNNRRTEALQSVV